MTDAIEIQPLKRPVRGSIRPPGSKSITNRALVCAALAEGSSLLTGALDSEDTRVMVNALARLGVQVQAHWQRQSLEVAGCGGKFPVSEAELFVANSGTSVRFLAAMVSLAAGRFRLDGVARMRERPIEDLLNTLRALGVDAQSEQGTGCPPVVIHAKGLAGGRAEIAGNVSSQFLSGLLMAAPYARSTIVLEVGGELVSVPYVHMTLAVMRSFGVAVDAGDLQQFTIPPQKYQGREYAIEPDASAASYFLAAAAITGGEVTVEGLAQRSLQGDVAFADVLGQMGCEVRYGEDSITVAGRPLHGIEVNMNAISDTVQTLAAVAPFADGPTTVTGVGHIRHKETDRLSAVATELRKLGVRVEEMPDGLRIQPGPLQPAEIATYNDHRMAMSFALVGLRHAGVKILDPGCTAKTYPNFFADLERLCGRGEGETRRHGDH